MHKHVSRIALAIGLAILILALLTIVWQTVLRKKGSPLPLSDLQALRVIQS